MHNNYQKDYKCANCQGNYGADSRDYEIWKKEKETTNLKQTQNITYPEAGRIVENTKYAVTKISQQPTNKTVICVKQAQPQNLRELLIL